MDGVVGPRGDSAGHLQRRLDVPRLHPGPDAGLVEVLEQKTVLGDSLDRQDEVVWQLKTVLQLRAKLLSVRKINIDVAAFFLEREGN